METVKRKCRLCGQTSKDSMRNIFSFTENGHQIVHLIKEYLPILIYRTDPLPKEICEGCCKNIINYDSFYNTSMKIYESFKLDLSNRADDPHVKLYLDSLQNQSEYFGESSKFSELLQKCIKPKTCTKYTNTLTEVKVETNLGILSNIKILTPNRINQINQVPTNSDGLLMTQLSDEERPKKRRRLIGPKSKMKQLTQRIHNPPTLFQIVLRQINIDLNTIDEKKDSEDANLVPPASPSSFMSLMEPGPDIHTDEENSLSNDFGTYDQNESAVCNYCIKDFNNMSELAHHEIQHIKVVLGPKVDSKEFIIRRRRFSYLYQDYLYRQKLAGSNTEVSKRTVKIVKPKPKPIPPPIKDIKPVVKDSIVIPSSSSANNNEFQLINGEIIVNGLKLTSLEKSDRRRLYKDVMINGIKRKYCPLCRHTFKDNWSIEYHYFNHVCRYTCKFCGIKFKFQKDLFDNHMKLHAGETATRIFGPRDRKYKFKKKTKISPARMTYTHPTVIPPKVKPLKMKHLLQKKLTQPIPVEIKTEPDLPPMDDSVTLEATGGNNLKPYQAFFCRKCFAVFYKIDQYNGHIQNCDGSPPSSTETSNKPSNKSYSPNAPSTHFNVTRSSDKTQINNIQEFSFNPLRRSLRSITREANALTETDSDTDMASKTSKGQEESETGFECGVCCSSFPSRHSRNSHMRIHKGQLTKTVLNKVAAKSHAIIRPEQQNVASNFISNVQTDIRLSSLDPTVARLVQNNPNLTIRSYTKPVEKQIEVPQQPQIRIIENLQDMSMEQNAKRVYKCGDCNEKFENKSVLYYHKMNSCIIKKHYECAFCRKKFGTYDQYNTHLFYVHPE